MLADREERLRQVLKDRNLRYGGWVYFIAAEGVDLVKIGFAVDIERRLASLSGVSPVALTLAGFMEGPRELESEVHDYFSEEREHYGWFRLSDALQTFIDEHTGLQHARYERQLARSGTSPIYLRDDGTPVPFGGACRRKDGLWIAQVMIDGRRSTFTGPNRGRAMYKLNQFRREVHKRPFGDSRLFEATP
jgi:hypothetical protein